TWPQVTAENLHFFLPKTYIFKLPLTQLFHHKLQVFIGHYPTLQKPLEQKKKNYKPLEKFETK
ncbi:hypothetical protein, partial [Lentilactobacillus buchneri]|uniref:hypothetical protein n=1 Tax=Lentilactobacillus buchneri TaxID=1581 RepID=UPI0038B3BF8B